MLDPRTPHAARRGAAPLQVRQRDASQALKECSAGARPDEADEIVLVRLETPVSNDRLPSLLDHADILLTPKGSAACAAPGVVVVDDLDAAAAQLDEALTRSPTAGWALRELVRITERLPVERAIVAESATYSTLLAGAEFQAWLEGRSASPANDGGDERVRMERSGDLMTVTLTRPRRRNAYDARMRDALLEALAVPALVPSLQVAIRGEGPDFCAGGDLGEFGSAADPAAAHRLRVAASPARALHRIRQQVTVQLHGNCVGSGIELAAFARRVVARPGTRAWLPELAMGLIPGAGGTVSLVRRAGRHRVLWWALSGERIDASTALSWGIIDEIADDPTP